MTAAINMLTAAGFTVGSDGVLHAPAAAKVQLAPIGKFWEVRIDLGAP